MKSLKLLFCVLIMSGLSVRAAKCSCASLSSSEGERLSDFVKRWFHIPESISVKLLNSSYVDSACYRRLVFSEGPELLPFAFYLSPDKSHLLSDRIDIRLDPETSQHKSEAELSHDLLMKPMLYKDDLNRPVNIVVFLDFQCPYCKRLEAVFRELSEEEKNYVTISYRQFPIPSHTWAREAAQISTCVALQNKSLFWKLRDWIFTEQQSLSSSDIQKRVLAFISDNGGNSSALTKCLVSKDFDTPLQRDRELAAVARVSSTPTVFVNGKRISVRSVADLHSAVAEARAYYSDQHVPNKVAITSIE